MDPTSQAGATLTGALEKALGEAVDAIYKASKRKVQHAIADWRTDAGIKRLAEHMHHVTHVKTLRYPGEAVDLSVFYYPSHLLFGGKRTLIANLDQLPSTNIAIEGSVGQGKSIFFRYLASQEMKRGHFVPVFLELRRLAAGQSLMDNLLEEMRLLGIPADPRVFRLLAKSGRLVLFLDGFDEVGEKVRAPLLTEIEHLSRRLPSLRILVSTRPESMITHSSHFRRVPLAPLAPDDYKALIVKLMDDADMAKQLLEGMTKRHQELLSLLTTPLMVTLLVVLFRASHSVPENVLAFYGDLFPLVLRDHDRKSKPGFKRPRRSRLSDSDMRTTFDTLAFVTRRINAGTFTRHTLLKHATQAIQRAQKSCTPDTFVDDIIDITCLIINDNTEYRFVHKSVQEYHAASFVADSTDEFARKFYSAMETKWSMWEQELEFLRALDAHRYFKWYRAPCWRRCLGLEGRTIDSSWTCDATTLVRLYGCVEIIVPIEWPHSISRGRLTRAPGAMTQITQRSVRVFADTFKMRATASHLGEYIAGMLHSFASRTDEKEVSISVEELAREPRCRSVLLDAATEALGAFIYELMEAEAGVHRREKSEADLGF